MGFFVLPCLFAGRFLRRKNTLRLYERRAAKVISPHLKCGYCGAVMILFRIIPLTAGFRRSSRCRFFLDSESTTSNFIYHKGHFIKMTCKARAFFKSGVNIMFSPNLPNPQNRLICAYLRRNIHFCSQKYYYQNFLNR